jgi:hypothetical protein
MTPVISVPQKPPVNPRGRISSDDVWPLRGSDGLTFAERKALRDKESK